MFGLHSDQRYYLYNQATDMRKSFDGLSGLVRTELKQDPCNGSVFIFINKRRNRVKLLQWMPGGFVLYYKRLEEGTLQIPFKTQAPQLKISYSQLVLLVEGLSIKNWSKRQRYSSTSMG